MTRRTTSTRDLLALAPSSSPRTLSGVAGQVTPGADTRGLDMRRVWEKFSADVGELRPHFPGRGVPDRIPGPPARSRGWIESVPRSWGRGNRRRDVIMLKGAERGPEGLLPRARG